MSTFNNFDQIKKKTIINYIWKTNAAYFLKKKRHDMITMKKLSLIPRDKQVNS